MCVLTLIQKLFLHLGGFCQWHLEERPVSSKMTSATLQSRLHAWEQLANTKQCWNFLEPFVLVLLDIFCFIEFFISTDFDFIFSKNMKFDEQGNEKIMGGVGGVKNYNQNTLQEKIIQIVIIEKGKERKLHFHGFSIGEQTTCVTICKHIVMSIYLAIIYI